MKVCILYGGADTQSARLKDISNAIARGIAQQAPNAVVEAFNMYQESGRNVSYYDYYVMGSEPVGFFNAKIPDAVYNFLRTCGNVSGKRFFCYINKKGLRSNKALSILMKALESQGAFITNFEVINSASLAQAIGKRLKLSKD